MAVAAIIFFIIIIITILTEVIRCSCSCPEASAAVKALGPRSALSPFPGRALRGCILPQLGPEIKR
jgi:hypothetical protein